MPDHRRQAIVRPPGEHLDRHGLGVWRPDDLQVAPLELGADRLELPVERAEAHHHPPLVDVVARHHDVDAVVVLVELALRALHRHAVLRAHGHRGADLVRHGYRRAACSRPSSPRSTAARAWGAGSSSNSWVARPSGGSWASSSRARSRLRSLVQAACWAAGIEDTCVLRIVRRRRWNPAPSDRGTGLVPYQDTTSAVPSCASSDSESCSTTGLPLASTRSGTPRPPVVSPTVEAS